MAGFNLGDIIGAVLGSGMGAGTKGRSPLPYQRAPSGNAQLARVLTGLAGLAIEAMRQSQSAEPRAPLPPPRPAAPAGKGKAGFDWAGPPHDDGATPPPIKKTPGQGGLKDMPHDPARPANPWGASPGSSKPGIDPWAPVKAEATPPEVDAESAEALLMLRVMIAAAKADGTIDAGERQRLATQLDGAGLSAAARDAILQDFDKPAPALALAKQATDPMLAAQLYAAAVMGAGEISAPERAWLEDFARALKLDRAAITAIEAKLIPV